MEKKKNPNHHGAKMNFQQVLTDAVDDFLTYGFDSQKRVDEWTKKIKDSALKSMGSEQTIQRQMEKSLKSVYSRLITNKGLLKQNVNISAFTIEKLKPKLRAELDRRIMASANLIKLNRQEAISNTIRRFQGWATSIPKGGSKAVPKQKSKTGIKKGIGRVSFLERRVIIDQTHKLTASINDIVALDSGAIAAKWRSHWKQPFYNYREDHKERDQKIYTIPDNWAIKKGLMKSGTVGYTTEITQPGEEVFCRCNYVYLYNLRQLPDDMLTKKGKESLGIK